MSEIAIRLMEVRRRIRTAAGVRGGLLAVAAAAAAVMLSLAIDRGFRLGAPARALSLAAYAGGLGFVIWRALLRPLLEKLPARALADLIERSRPDLEDRFRSAVDFLRDPAVAAPAGREPADLQTAFKRSVVAEAERAAPDLRHAALIDNRAVARAGAAGGAALLLAALVFGLSAAGTFGLWFRRNVLLGDVEWPYRTRLLVLGFEGGRRGVPRGDPLEIEVTAEGEVPDRAWILEDYGSTRRRLPLAAGGERSFRAAHPEVREPFTFRVEGGDYRSPPYRVEILERPRLESLRITQHFPEYIGAPPAVAEGAIGELAVPVGTRLEIEAAASKDLRQAGLLAEAKEVPLAIDPADPRRLRGEYLPLATGTATFSLLDSDGVVPDSPTQISIRLVPDRPPAVKLRAFGIGSLVSASARIPLAIEVTDDYRITALELRHRISAEGSGAGGSAGNEGAGGEGPAPAAEPIEGRTEIAEIGDGIPPLRREHAFEVDRLKVEPEKKLEIQAAAADNDALNGPNIGLSGTLEFLVVTHERLLDDFLRRQEEQRRAFERAIQSQRAIRDALYREIDGGLKKPGELEAAAAQELLAHARDERLLGNQAFSIAAAIDAILVEMGNNRIGEADDIRRLGEMVVDPLQAIAAGELPDAAGRFEGLRGEPESARRLEGGLRLAEDIERLIQRMDAILANMVKLEGFSEIVKRLRGIIDLHRESSEAARKAYDNLLQSIFENPGEEPPPSGRGGRSGR